MSPIAHVAAAIGAATGHPFDVLGQQQSGGGCINQAWVLSGRDGRRFFVKLNAADHGDMFAAEADGLTALEATLAIRVPRPVAQGTRGAWAFLALEWLELDGYGSGAELGRRLAQLHGNTGAQFGWHRDNTIGSTRQPNPPTSDWVSFFAEHRLGNQCRLASNHGAPRDLVESCERLIADLAAFFAGHRPIPSLLHGDLWSGNNGYVAGVPVLFDPAVYFGDREADLAMTELFGGFPDDFQPAYREAWPLDAGYSVRRVLYNLYHALNHFNLFGGTYGEQARAMTRQLLAEIR